MLIILRLIGTIRGLRRRLYGGETPHWAADLYKILKYGNFVELLPTTAIILIAPQHFFDHLPQILSKRSLQYKTPYRSPIGFLGRLTLFTYGADKWIYAKVAVSVGLSGTQNFFFLLFVLPFVTPLVPLLLVGPYLLIPGLMSGIAKAPSWRLNSRQLLVASDPQSYLSIGRQNRLWGFFYFYAYAFFALQLLALFAISVGAVFVQTVPSESGIANRFLPSAILVSCFAVVLAVDYCLVRPYVALLKSVVRVPTARMIAADTFSLETTMWQTLKLLRKQGAPPESLVEWAPQKEKEIRLQMLLIYELPMCWDQVEKTLEYWLRRTVRLDVNARRDVLAKIAKALSALPVNEIAEEVASGRSQLKYLDRIRTFTMDVNTALESAVLDQAATGQN